MVTFSTVLHAVDDVGLDPTGGQPIEADVQSALSDGTVIEFPDGDFLIGDYLDIDDYANVGLRATTNGNPTLVPGTQGANLPGGTLFLRFTTSDFEFGGFDIDFQTDGYYGEMQLDAPTGDLHVHDIRRLGLVPGHIDGMFVSNQSASGSGLIERVYFRDGARSGTSASGIQVRAKHAGVIDINDCEIWHMPSKGIYASSMADPDVGAGGVVHVNGGFFKNNNDADVRIGSPESTCKNIISVKWDDLQGETVTWEHAIPRRDWDGQTGIVQTRSIRLEAGSNCLVENCEFEHDIGQGAGVITCEGSHDGNTTIRNCRIEVNDVEIYPILINDNSGPYTIDDVSLTGTGGVNGREEGIRIEAGNSGTDVINSCINLTGTGQDGVVVYSSSNCSVENSNITVDGQRVVFVDTSGTVSGITSGASCPAPDTTTGGGGGAGSTIKASIARVQSSSTKVGVDVEIDTDEEVTPGSSQTGGKIAVVGSELQFLDSNGQIYAYEGDIVSDVHLSKNMGILGDYLYYKDELSYIRRLPAENIGTTSSERGYLTVSDEDSYLIYVDEQGDKQIAHGDQAHSDSPHSDSSHSDKIHSDKSHGDAGHGDSSHQDDATHQDKSHGDDIHNDFSDISHGDEIHGDDSHGDDAFSDFSDISHGDDVHADDLHDDSPHSDFTDSSGSFGDLSHDDIAHDDKTHSNKAGENFTDQSHSDKTHSDKSATNKKSENFTDQSHSDKSHSDDSHADAPHADEVHSDASHSDELHSDDAHSDGLHQDGSHADTTHNDTPNPL